jgi:23S rRNA (guanine745-N1)-methyltransferase
VFELPLRDASVDCVTSVFAPCAEEEFCRVLCPGGVLIVVGAGERHLMGLKRAIYDDIYENAGRADLPQGMVLLEEYTVEREIEVTGEEQIAHLFSMTPYYWRTSRADADKLRGLQSLTTTVAFDFKIYQKSK